MMESAYAIWLLTRNILKVSFHKKTTLITIFILPILGILLSIGIYSRDNSGVSRIGLIDRDQSMLSQDLIKSLVRGNFQVTAMNEKAMNNGLVAGTIDCALVIPRGFAASAFRNHLRKVTIVSIKGEAGSAWIKGYIAVLMQNLKDIGAAAGGGKKTFQQIYAGYRREQTTVQVVKVANPSRSKGITSQSIGFLILFMLVGVGNCVEMILKEKRNRTYYRICAAPVSSRCYVLGNVLANLMIVMIQALLALLMITQVFRYNTYVPFWQLYLILVLFGLAAIGFGLLIVAFSRDTTQAGILQNLIILPTCFVTGCFWPVEIMPRGLRRVGDFLPQKWTIAAIQRLQEGAGLRQVMIHLVIILAFALTFFLIAAYRFGRNDDMKSFV